MSAAAGGDYQTAPLQTATSGFRPRKAILFGIVGWVIAISLWSWISVAIANPAILPSPLAVLQAVSRNWSESQGLAFLGMHDPAFYPNLRYTVVSALGAWLIGTMMGLGLGLLGARSQIARYLTEPLLLIIGPIPVLVVAPFMLIWFGFSRTAQVLFVLYYSFIMALAAAQSSALQIPSIYEEYGASLGAGWWRRLTKIVGQCGFPGMIGQLRISLGMIWGLQAIAELMGSSRGVGPILNLRSRLGDMAAMMGVVLVLGAVAMIFDQLFTRGARYVTRWTETG